MKTSNMLTRWIMLSMVAGVVVGYACNPYLTVEEAKNLAGYFAIATDSFLWLIKSKRCVTTPPP